MTQPLHAVRDALIDGQCLLLTLSKLRRGITADFQKVTVRPVIVQQRNMFQLTYKYSQKEEHENLEPAVAAEKVADLLTTTFEHAALYTPAADLTLRARPDGSFKLRSQPPSKTMTQTDHNRTKAYLIPENVRCPFLIEIGVMTADGRVRSSMYHKFRQINRYLELVQDIVVALPKNRVLRVVDFGCGKSYLTFALHHLLTVVHHFDVQIVGLDLKADVIRDCSEIARKLGCNGLEFREGDLQSYLSMDAVDLSVSLHACDIATDAALAQAVRWQCAVILAVPCCQHELASQIENAALSPLLNQGILRDRFSAIVTDALRAQVLEICGYATQVVEFIDMEHTPKNVLIRAVRRTQPDPRHAERVAEYAAYKQLLKLDQPYLERELNPDLAGEPGT